MSYLKAEAHKGYVIVRVVDGNGSHDAWISPKEAKALAKEIRAARRSAKEARRDSH